MFTGVYAGWKRNSKQLLPQRARVRDEGKQTDIGLESLLTQIFIEPGGNAKNCMVQPSVASLLQLSAAALAGVIGLSLPLLDHVNNQTQVLGVWLLLLSIANTPINYVKELAAPVLSKVLSLNRYVVSLQYRAKYGFTAS